MLTVQRKNKGGASNENGWKPCRPIYIYIYISILLQKKENTRENSLEKIGFDFDAIKKENINRKEVGYSYVKICS